MNDTTSPNGDRREMKVNETNEKLKVFDDLTINYMECEFLPERVVDKNDATSSGSSDTSSASASGSAAKAGSYTIPGNNGTLIFSNLQIDRASAELKLKGEEKATDRDNKETENSGRESVE